MVVLPFDPVMPTTGMPSSSRYQRARRCRAWSVSPTLMTAAAPESKPSGTRDTNTAAAPAATASARKSCASKRSPAKATNSAPDGICRVSVETPPETLDAEFRSRFPDAPPALHEDLHDPWYELYLVFGRDRAYAKMLDHVLARGEQDFVAFYVNGPDIASHYFWKYRFPDEWPIPIPAGEMASGRDVIGQAYAYADELIGGLTQLADERCLVIVLSDHGFVTGHRGDSLNISGVHWRDAPPGIIVMAGAGIAPGTELERGSVKQLLGVH